MTKKLIDFINPDAVISLTEFTRKMSFKLLITSRCIYTVGLVMYLKKAKKPVTVGEVFDNLFSSLGGMYFNSLLKDFENRMIIAFK